MKKRLGLVAALVVLASTAHSATLSISGGGTYNIGDIVTLTITGDSQGALALAVGGDLNLTNPIFDTASATVVQNTLITTASFSSVPWIVVPTLSCNATSCFVFGQISPFGTAAVDASNLLVATITFVTDRVGTTVFSWETDPFAGGLEFFGLTNAPGTTVSVLAPEPATALLVALGLLGLGVRARR